MSTRQTRKKKEQQKKYVVFYKPLKINREIIWAMENVQNAELHDLWYLPVI